MTNLIKGVDNFSLEIYRKNLQLRQSLIELDFEIIERNYMLNLDFVKDNNKEIVIELYKKGENSPKFFKV